jgi:hypothetical protein
MQIKNSALRLVGAGLIAVALAPWMGGAGTALAGGEGPPSGDDRATSHDGNTVTCAGAGLTGDIVTVTSTQDGTYIDITAVPAGKTVTGVVVKGGDAYNIYLPGALGSLPWLDLHAPLNPNGSPAGISHWFVCATTGSTSSTPVETTSSAPVETTSSAPVETTSSAPATTTSSAPATTTSSAPVVVSTTASQSAAQQSVSVLPTKAENTTATESDDTEVLAAEAGQLPHTGAGLPVGVLLMVSLGLLLGGGALMLLPGLALAKGHHRRH